VNQLLPLVNGIATNPDDQYVEDVGPSPAELQTLATEKHVQRM